MTKKKYNTTCVILSDEELKKLKLSSLNTGLTIPKLLKESFFSQSGVITPNFSRDDTITILKHLSAIGNNLNQIARHLNSGFNDKWMIDFSFITKEFEAFKVFLVRRGPKDASSYTN